MNNKIIFFCKKNAPAILSLLACTGVVVTGVLTAKGTIKALEKLDSMEDKEELSIGEKAGVIAPYYIPAIGAGIGTIACIAGACVLSKQHQAQLTSAYGLLNNYFKDYRRTLIDLHGEEIDTEVRREMSRNRYDYHVIDCELPDDEKIWFIETYTGQKKLCYEREIMDAEYHINRNFTMRGYVTLNEYLYFLGLKPDPEGDVIGWCVDDEFYWIDFKHDYIYDEDDPDKKKVGIYYLFEPTMDLIEYGCID